MTTLVKVTIFSKEKFVKTGILAKSKSFNLPEFKTAKFHIEGVAYNDPNSRILEVKINGVPVLGSSASPWKLVRNQFSFDVDVSEKVKPGRAKCGVTLLTSWDGYWTVNAWIDLASAE